jgi:hypothetical protein
MLIEGEKARERAVFVRRLAGFHQQRISVVLLLSSSLSLSLSLSDFSELFPVIRTMISIDPLDVRILEDPFAD